jgi:hypothetical protein
MFTRDGESLLVIGAFLMRADNERASPVKRV